MMGRPIGITGETVLRYLEKYPTMPNKTVADLIFKENKAVFVNVDTVRAQVRYYKGRSGKKNRERVTDTRFLLPELTPENRYQLPEFNKTNYTPYFVPSKLKRGLLFADIHIPYASKEAVEIALDDAKAFDIDFIIIDGDLLDCYHLSSFAKDPRERNFTEEIKLCKTFLHALKNQFPKAFIIVKEGNHDRRYEDYLMKHAPQLIGFEEFHLSVLLDCFNLGIDYVGEKRVIQCGKLNVIHGDEYWGAVSSPANPARTAFLRTKSNTIMAHHHQTSEHSEPTIREELITCWSLGCMCDLHPHYMPLNKWNWGYALVEKDEKGNFHVENKRVWKGKAL